MTDNQNNQVPFGRDVWDGIKYNLDIRNTLREMRELPKSALIVFAFLMVGLAVYFFLLGDYEFWGILSIVGLVVSSINLVLVDNGKITSYIWGIICSVCSIIGAFHYQMYGDVVYYLWVMPWMIIGMGQWTRLARERREGGEDTNDTVALSVPRKQVPLYVLLLLISYGIMYLISSNVGGAVPLIDSGILALGVVGQVFLSKSYKQQWIVWIAQDAVGVSAWTTRLVMAAGVGEVLSYPISMVIMWGIFLVNAIYGCWQWYHANDKKEQRVEMEKVYAAPRFVSSKRNDKPKLTKVYSESDIGNEATKRKRIRNKDLPGYGVSDVYAAPQFMREQRDDSSDGANDTEADYPESLLSE